VGGIYKKACKSIAARLANQGNALARDAERLVREGAIKLGDSPHMVAIPRSQRFCFVKIAMDGSVQY